METIEKAGAPLNQVLADITRGCYPDVNDRTVAVTALVVSLWQLAGRGMTHRSPSLILLNASEEASDPVDAFSARLLDYGGHQGPREFETGPYARRHPKHAPTVMANAILEKDKLGKLTPQNQHAHRKWEDLYFAAQASGFGTARCRPYSTAWHETFDLITNPDDRIILRLGNPETGAVFRHHVLHDEKKLLLPTGYGNGLRKVGKHITVSGSLLPEIWDGKMAEKMVELGLPFVFLPHVCTTPPVIENIPAIEHLTLLLPNAFRIPLEEPANLLPEKWHEEYGNRLRERLRELPSSYEYTIQRAVRQLYPVCRRLAVWSGQQSQATAAEIEPLLRDLYGHTLRGIVIGVAGLAWHGLGFHTGVPHAVATKVLKHLRGKGATSKTDLMRGLHLTAGVRDALLEHLVAEGLVRLEGNTITATIYRDFVSGLYSRKEFPVPADHWAESAAGAT